MVASAFRFPLIEQPGLNRITGKDAEKNPG
jgi:hypothetical protein